MAELSDYLENLLINWLRGQVVTQPSGLYVALHTADPTDAATGAEISGGSYARQAVTLGAPASGVSSNTNVLAWTNLPAATLNFGSLWDASTAGNMLAHSPLTATQVVALGDNYSIGVGGLTFTLT